MFHFFRHHHHRFEARMPGHHHGGGRGPKMFDAGAMRYVVLHLIADKPRHGYELIKEIEQLAGGSYAPSPGAIYPLLSMLLDMGHIVTEADGNKKLHSITPEGRAFLDENRQLLDAVLARLCGPQTGRVDLRHLMRELKAAVVNSVHATDHDEGRIAQVQAILQRALGEIAQLGQA